MPCTPWCSSPKPSRSLCSGVSAAGAPYAPGAVEGPHLAREVAARPQAVRSSLVLPSPTLRAPAPWGPVLLPFGRAGISVLAFSTFARLLAPLWRTRGTQPRRPPTSVRRGERRGYVQAASGSKEQRTAGSSVLVRVPGFYLQCFNFWSPWRVTDLGAELKRER